MNGPTAFKSSESNFMCESGYFGSLPLAVPSSDLSNRSRSSGWTCGKRTRNHSAVVEPWPVGVLNQLGRQLPFELGQLVDHRLHGVRVGAELFDDIQQVFEGAVRQRQRTRGAEPAARPSRSRAGRPPSLSPGYGPRRSIDPRRRAAGHEATSYRQKSRGLRA